MKKRLISTLLVLAILCACMPQIMLPAMAADSDFVIENGVLTKYNGTGGAVTIPDGVVAIGKEAFIWSSLTSVTFPDSLQYIDEEAFACSDVTAVTFPDNVTAIGKGAFMWCGYLTDVTFGSGVTTIGEDAFHGCGVLKNVTFGDKVATIGEGAFYSCFDLSKVTFPDSLQYISDRAFDGSGLTDVTIPESVAEIGVCAFDCYYLTEATILNRDCVLKTRSEEWIDDIIVIGPFGNRMYRDKVTIIGYRFSTAEESAYKCGLPFRDIDDSLPPLDRRSLYEVVFEAENIDRDMYYDDEAMPAFVEALAAAKLVQADETAGQDEVDTAAKAVREAIDALRPNKNFLFNDVRNPDKFYFDAVYWAFRADPQITNGMERYYFRPNASCTRGHVAAFLWRAAGCPEPKNTETPFKDLKKGAFYEKAVAWAVENGITNGLTADRFGPDAKCTRGQIMTFLWRAAGCPEPERDETPFTDVKPDAFYEKAVAWAVEQGITNGMTADMFGPDSRCNRGQIVTFLYRAISEEYQASAE